MKQAAKIRRTVENEAYNILSKCPTPRKGEEFWDVSPMNLEEKVSRRLGDADGQLYNEIKTHVQVFLESEDYQEMIDQFREDYYCSQYSERDPYAYHGVSQTDFMSIQGSSTI